MTTGEDVTPPQISPALPLIMVCAGLCLAMTGVLLRGRRKPPLGPHLYRATQPPHHG